jgi:hypothetical protein
MAGTWKQEYGIRIRRLVLSVSEENRWEPKHSPPPDTGTVFLLPNLTIFWNLSAETGINVKLEKLFQLFNYSTFQLFNYSSFQFEDQWIALSEGATIARPGDRTE